MKEHNLQVEKKHLNSYAIEKKKNPFFDCKRQHSTIQFDVVLDAPQVEKLSWPPRSHEYHNKIIPVQLTGES